MRTRSNENLIGLAVFAVFCGLAVWVWLPQPQPQVMSAPSVADDVNSTLQAGQEELAGFIAVTGERPLFHATRRPQPAPEQPAAPVAPEPVLTLVGILGVSDNRVALVRISTSAGLYRLSEGAQLGAWTIQKINPNTIEVTKDGGPPEVLTIGG